MKNKLKSLIALALVCCMALSLAACGSEGGKQQQEQQPEYVYSSTFKPLSNASNGYLSVQAFTSDGAYANSYEKIGRSIPEGVDASALSEDELMRYDEYGTILYFIDNNDNITKLDNYEPIPKKENTGNYSEFNSSSSINSMTADKDGNLVVIESLYTGWYDGPEGKTWADEDYYTYYKNEQAFYLRTLDKTGAELSSVTLEVGPEQYIYGTILMDEAGNLLTGGEDRVIAFDSTGKKTYEIECGNYIQSLIKLNDGKNYVVIWGDNGCELAPIDSATQSLGATVPLPSNAYNPLAGGGDYDLYFTDGLYFCGYSMETETTDKLFNWVNCDINSDESSSIRVADDGSVTGIISEYDQSDESYTSERFTVSKVRSDSLPAKETLTLACMWLDYNVRDMVIKFNRASDKLRISIQDYSEFNTEDDYEAGSQKFLTSVMAGDSADIISLNGLPYRQIAAKGLLEDLYPYLDNDSELNREDFFQNVFTAMEVGGKLYSTCPSFSVTTVIGAESVVGDRTSWTYDELDEALATMPEGCEVFDQYTTRDSILQTCLNLDMQSYVNWETKECNFNSEQFVKLLEFAKRFPETVEYADDYTPEDSTENRVKTGRQMLVATSIYGVDDLYYTTSYFGGSPIKYIGYPTMSGSGNMISTESGYAMSSTCKNKEAAWDFLRTFYTEKYQKNNVWSIPTNLNVYEDKLAEAMKITYMTDEKGEYILDENGEKKMQPRYSIGSEDGSTVNIYAMTQEQADSLWQTITSTTKLSTYDESIYNIVSEQSAAFFAGQKSAEEVAKLVQSKAQIYVSEQG